MTIPNILKNINVPNHQPDLVMTFFYVWFVAPCFPVAGAAYRFLDQTAGIVQQTGWRWVEYLKSRDMANTVVNTIVVHA